MISLPGGTRIWLAAVITDWRRPERTWKPQKSA